MQKPNIITILVDDMGFSDLACYGGEAQTPNLDRLAASGVRFTDFYCSPRCCPSRASLLTGLTPHKAGVGWMDFDWRANVDPVADGYAGTLNHRCVTIAEALRPAGYRTYMSGKWHLTSHYGDKSTWPVARGFDRSFVLVRGGTSYFEPKHLALDDKYYLAPKQTYFTNLVGDYAVKFVNEHSGGESSSDPFFLYLPFTAPHFPIQAPEESIGKYVDIYSRGWDVLRKERHRRMIEMGIVKPEWELPPRPEQIPAWSSLPAYQRARHARQMATYAAMIEIMDANVGKVLAALEQAGTLENTAIMFLSDNGACAEGAVMGTPNLYGECWAHLSNTPLQLYKHNTKQGGVQTSFIFSHPQTTAAAAGTLSDWTACLYDIMPTCLELAGAEYPADRPELHPLDGESFLRAFDRSPAPRSRDIPIEHEGNQMLRAGDYKIVRQHEEPFWQLHDMEADRTEMHDLSGSEPVRLRELARRYYEWEQGAEVIPWQLAGRYIRLYGYPKESTGGVDSYMEALAKAAPEEIVDGEELGD